MLKKGKNKFQIHFEDERNKLFNQALSIGRPPSVVSLFPNSRALIVSGKFIDRAMLKKGSATCIAVNGRSAPIIVGALRAAQKTDSAIIIEIAKSEGGPNPYCATTFWNIARMVDTLCNYLGITIPVAIHADHFTIKNEEDVETAKSMIPTLFDAGMTSIAIDASHLSDEQNLMANIELFTRVPAWAGYETEVGEIRGKEGLSTAAEALFLIEGLNAHNIFPDWIALNNGTVHGIESGSEGIQVELTAKIHHALAPYFVSGAQHGTSGNSFERLCQITNRTRTTKANVATALQMISWGLAVDDYGNAKLDANGQFIKMRGEGVTEKIWKKMEAYAKREGLKKGDYKKLNGPFEIAIREQSRRITERIYRRVEAFVFYMITEVFNSADTAPMVMQEILEAGSYFPSPKASRIEQPEDWTPEKIAQRATTIHGDKGSDGNFDD